MFNKDFLLIADANLYTQEVQASFEMIIENRMIPTDLVNYGKMSEEIFSNYTSGAIVISRYVKETATGNGDGSSWDNSDENMQTVIDRITDASENKIYIVLIASGVYKPETYFMKNHVAMVGGFAVGRYDQSGETPLDDDNDKRVFYNYNLDRTALLYKMIITNGNSGDADDNGGGIYHDGDGQPLTLINMIFWNNNKGQIYLRNNPSTIATGIRLNDSDTNANPININSEKVIENDPGLVPLADNGGEIDTISIGNNSPAKDKGVYVRWVKSDTGNLYPEANLYYSENNTDWYSDPGLTTQESPPSDADDLTTTDARGYGRVGRPDMGAYEEGGTAP